MAICSLSHFISKIMNKLFSLEERLNRIEKLLLTQKEVFSLDEACEYCNFSKSYMYKLTAAQRIPHYKRNKFIFFKKSELDAYLLEVRVKTIDEIDQEASNYLINNSKG